MLARAAICEGDRVDLPPWHFHRVSPSVSARSLVFSKSLELCASVCVRAYAAVCAATFQRTGNVRPSGKEVGPGP